MVVKGLSASAAYIKAGYSKASAKSNAARMMENEGVLARIAELQTTVTDAVVASEIRKRSWRVQQLQEWADDMLALKATRKVLYGDQRGEGRGRTVHNADEEKDARAQGYEDEPGAGTASSTTALIDRVDGLEGKLDYILTAAGEPPAPEAKVARPEYPKFLVHPGYPIGGHTGLLIKDYRGKNAEQEIWKFDAALVSRFCDTLKQAAIEEGQWSEKRQMNGGVGIHMLMEELQKGRQRCADAKKALDIEREAKRLEAAKAS